ncbi:hypothetical protein MUP01_11970 [Candidatus Bathyarchaeota archaeon]|nr:hypothetical protein [Candidatus Bathyarchaeota archaeon]
MSINSDRNLSKLSAERKDSIRTLVEIYYDVQDVRIRSFNRLRQVWGRIEYIRKFGLPPAGPKELKKFLLEAFPIEDRKRLVKEYVATCQINPNILAQLEKQIRDHIKDEVEPLAIVRDYLRNVKGIGPILAGGLVSFFDPYKAPHPSSFWKYAGLHVVEGEAPKRVKGAKLGFNPRARVLCWKIADSFIKQRTPLYRPYYDVVKVEEAAKFGVLDPDESVHPERCPKYLQCLKRMQGRAQRTNTKAKACPCLKHIDYRARRKMVKLFIADFWAVWRKMEGLPPSEPYSVRILGHDKAARVQAEPDERKNSEEIKGGEEKEPARPRRKRVKS